MQTGFWHRVCGWGRVWFGIGGMVVSCWFLVVMGVGRLVFDLDHPSLLFEEGVSVRYSGPDPRSRRKVTRTLSLKVKGLIGPGVALQRDSHSWTFVLHSCHMAM